MKRVPKVDFDELIRYIEDSHKGDSIVIEFRNAAGVRSHVERRTDQQENALFIGTLLYALKTLRVEARMKKDRETREREIQELEKLGKKYG